MTTPLHRPQEEESTDAPADLPAELSLPSLRQAARGCRGCPLWRRGTQTVFGAGPEGAELMVVGEQPEIAVLRPRAILCLGATAAQALLGRGFKVTARRGQAVPTALAPLAMATIHPSSILRIPDDRTRRAEMARFVDDLRALREAMASQRG